MKKYICFAAALAIVGAASCNKELVDNNGPEVPEVKIATLTATIGEPDTKTTLAAPEDAHTFGSAVHWAAEDALSVFDGASNVKYTIKTEEDVDYTPAPTAVFEGTELAAAESYYALYPYTETATLAGGVIKGAVLPATQTAVEGNIPAGAALAVAYTEDRETINFMNVATIIGFTLTEAAEKVVFVATGDEAIAGTIDVTPAKDAAPTYEVQDETGSNTITLTDLAAGTYYFTILPDVTLTQGYEFYIGTELAKSNTNELTLVRSKIYSLGEVKVPLKDRELSFSPASYEIIWGDDFTEPTLNGLTNTDQVTYSSDNEEVAIVDETTGEVTLNKAGTVTITATVAATDTHNEGSATYTLNIEKAVRTVSFAESSKTVTYGENVVHPVLNDVTGSDNVSYEIVEGDAATINNEGVVTLVKAGTVTIKATVAATETHIECSSTYVLTVNAPKLYVEDDSDYSKSYLYLYDNSGDNSWPGEELSATETINGVKYKVYTVPEDKFGKTYTYIFNNGTGAQVEENKTITFNGNNYIWLTNKYTETLDKNNTGKQDKLTLYIEDSREWKKLSYYVWNSSSQNGWPGVAVDMTKNTKIENKTFYYVELGAHSWDNIIITNGDTWQTGDLAIKSKSEDIFVSNAGDGHIWTTSEQKF